MGYYRAGFEVVGVDIKPQPHYPFQFHQADALSFPLDGFDVVHASPPCQAYTKLAALHPGAPDLVADTRAYLEKGGGAWVIENVPGAPMRSDVVLCGSMFGLMVWRHRWFEFAQPLCALTPPCNHREAPIGVYGHPGGRGVLHGVERHPVATWRAAMGIDWMTGTELAQAIPPAYTEWIGGQLQAVL